MKYFTPELFVHLQSSNSDAADDDWEHALVRYRRRLDRIRRDLPRAIRHLAYDIQLHDAEVLSLARENGRFVIVLRLPVPRNRTVIFTYRLESEPKIDTASFPPKYCSNEARWLYDEIDVITGKTIFRHSVLLSNGWQLQLRFRDVTILEADGLLRPPLGAERAAMGQSA